MQAALGQRPEIKIYGTDYETPDGTCVRDYVTWLMRRAPAGNGSADGWGQGRGLQSRERFRVYRREVIERRCLVV